MSILKVNTIQDKGGNAIISSDGSGTLTLGNSALQGVPAFLAKRSGNQVISDVTDSKLQCDTEVFDTNNAYDNSSNYRFTPAVAGKYFIFGAVMYTNFPTNKPMNVKIVKNGSGIATVANLSGGYQDDLSSFVSYIDEANTTDYYELNTFHRGGSALNANTQTYFGAYRIIGA